jgi:uncharacterized membrane protein YhaH (DUF805 family)
MNWYLTALKKYAVFSGRSRRKEYWMFCLFSLIFAAAAMAVDGVLGSAIGVGYRVVYMLYSLAVFIPSIAVSVRRLHDVGKSGWFLLIAFIPLIGFIWLIILVCSDSEAGTTQYGPNPKLAPA